MANTRHVRPQPGRPAHPRPRPAVQVAPFDLDAYESDGAQEPFRFTTGGEEFSMTNLDDTDWQELDAAQTTGEVVLLALGDEQYERFCKHSLSTAKMKALVTKAKEYYGAGEGSA